MLQGYSAALNLKPAVGGRTTRLARPGNATTYRHPGRRTAGPSERAGPCRQCRSPRRQRAAATDPGRSTPPTTGGGTGPVARQLMAMRAQCSSSNRRTNQPTGAARASLKTGLSRGFATHPRRTRSSEHAVPRGRKSSPKQHQPTVLTTRPAQEQDGSFFRELYTDDPTTFSTWVTCHSWYSGRTLMKPKDSWSTEEWIRELDKVISLGRRWLGVLPSRSEGEIRRSTPPSSWLKRPVSLRRASALLSI